MTLVWILIAFTVLAAVVGTICVTLVGGKGRKPDDGSDYVWVDVDSDDPGIKQTRFRSSPKVGDVFTVISQRTEKVDYFLIDEVDHANGMMDCHILQKEELEDALKTH